MKNKSETRYLLNTFVIYAQNQFNKRIKIIRTDNGFEFDYKTFYDDFDIFVKPLMLKPLSKIL